MLSVCREWSICRFDIQTIPQSPVGDSSTATALPLPFSAVASVGAKRLPPASSALYTREPLLTPEVKPPTCLKGGGMREHVGGIVCM